MSGMDEENLDLDRSLVSALKDVPPADPKVREAHISAAISQLAVSAGSGAVSPISSARARRAFIPRVLSAAAAAVVLLGAGFLVGSASSDRANNGLATEGVDARGGDTTVPVKGGGGGESPAAQDPASTVTQMSPCDERLGLALLARYETTDGWNAAYLRIDPTPAIMIVAEETCAVVREIALP